ncbi:hypothetical protein D9736_21850 [Escherichia sp. E10V10]|nr:hypothetical protein D9736_21850 [Escherichia sp. E10V10]
MIRRASVASGIVYRTADAAKTPYPAYGMSGFVGMIRRASVASGIVYRAADEAKTPYPPE